MAVTKTFNSRSLSFTTTTTDANGKSTKNTKSFNNMKQSATDENILNVANSIKAVMLKTVDDVIITEKISISE